MLQNSVAALMDFAALSCKSMLLAACTEPGAWDLLVKASYIPTKRFLVNTLFLTVLPRMSHPAAFSLMVLCNWLPMA